MVHAYKIHIIRIINIVFIIITRSSKSYVKYGSLKVNRSYILGKSDTLVRVSGEISFNKNPLYCVKNTLK